MAEDATYLDGSKSNETTPSKRGHPSRIRKPNPKFEYDEVPGYSPRPRKHPRPQQITPQKVSLLSAPDKKSAQCIGVRLRNLLKLPKAHKWVCYEWFYSNIDLALFAGENDFCICLQENFPQLKTRKLSFVEWCKVRRLMGKPRRCSAAFFQEERTSLLERRQKIRQLQQSKSADSVDYKDLPDEIPILLSVGDKVTARLRRPQDGLFTGIIDAVDTTNFTYRVMFDRVGLGTHVIPDYEVLSNEESETMPTSTFQNIRRQLPLGSQFDSPAVGSLNSPNLPENDPLLGAHSPLISSNPDNPGTGMTMDDLHLVVRLNKILNIKQEKVKKLRDMNTEAENMSSHGSLPPPHFQQSYADLILELEKLNLELNQYLQGVRRIHADGETIERLTPSDSSSDLQLQLDAQARDMTRDANIQNDRMVIKNEGMLELVSKLTSLLLQIKHFSENDTQCFEFKSLDDSLASIKASLDPSNYSSFENNVEVHIKYIQTGMSRLGNLHRFTQSY